MRYVALLLAFAVAAGAQGSKPRSTPPVVLYVITPEYTQEAREARVEGDVLLSANIGVDGKVSNMRVTKPLGRPFAVRENIKVEFRLSSK